MSTHPWIRPITLVSLVVLVMASCDLPVNIIAPNQPAVSTPDANAIYTAAAQTLVAQLTQNAPPPSQPTYTAPPTFTAAPDTPTLEPTETPGPGTPTPTITLQPVFSPTPFGQIVTANIATNCRKGPGPNYDVVGYLKEGDTAQILGRNNSRSWWYIENPSNAGYGCWVWGVTAKASGDTASLPVFTPPPPPYTSTPSGGSGSVSFSLSLATTRKCSGDKTAIMAVHNSSSSSTVFESANIKSTDMKSGDTLDSYSDNSPFTDSKTDCSGSIDTLDSGETLYIPIGLAGASSGDQIKVGVTLCTKEDLNGKCVSSAVKFDMP